MSTIDFVALIIVGSMLGFGIGWLWLIGSVSNTTTITMSDPPIYTYNLTQTTNASPEGMESAFAFWDNEEDAVYDDL